MEQHPEEFAWLLSYVGGAKSLLEIGSREGASLRGFAEVMVPGARICSIDYGRGIPNVPEWDTEIGLRKTCDELRGKGFDVHLHIGNSHADAARKFAEKLCPFSFLFIDGDHSYDGVREDWLMYGGMAKVVAFHDIGIVNADGMSGIGAAEGVWHFWRELKLTGVKTVECRLDPQYGIGIVLHDIRGGA